MTEPKDERQEGAVAEAPEEKGLAEVDPATLPPPTRDELDSLRRERDELKDQLLRRRADFENYRKRVERDRHQAGFDAVADVIRALVPIIDNLERALAAETTATPLKEGVELTHRELLAALEAQGVVIQAPLGEKFDPEAHQALSHEVVPGHAEGTIVEVYRKGYLLKDRLLRPALVRVAKAPDGHGEGDAGAPKAVH